MRYVILRDDDTNALTPVECLERLYRPFLDRGLPVNLAVIPDVATDAVTPDGKPEGFLFAKNGAKSRTVAIGQNPRLVEYLLENPGYGIVQHGCHHDPFEFDCESTVEICARLDRGTWLLKEAGLPTPQTFVAPHDKLSRLSYRQVARRFRVLSTGWFELRRLPLTWWPKYLVKKTRNAPHWRVGGTLLLSHPGCLLSCHRNYDTMLTDIISSIHSRRLTVLVTHWWEYFRGGKPDGTFIQFLHETAAYLAKRDDIKVISFADLARGEVPLS
jgi:hypothetical protein